MRRRRLAGLIIAAALLASGPVFDAQRGSQQTAGRLGFFVTSVNPGKGADLGGLTGADAHCQKLAAVVGAGQRKWRAYLSARASGTQTAVHARDRIGTGPWANAKGVQIAASLTDLHSPTNRVAYATALTETGVVVPRERHDILTGSNGDGTLARSAPDTTCNNWRSSVSGAAMVGHTDRGEGPLSWSSAHLTRGCSEATLREDRGGGLFYCFAAD